MDANILRILVVLLGIALVSIILIQQPKEGGLGAFSGGGGGAGASSTVFGAKGGNTFFFKTTAIIAILFALTIAVLVARSNNAITGSILTTQPAASEVPQLGDIDGEAGDAQETVPAVPTPEVEPGIDPEAESEIESAVDASENAPVDTATDTLAPESQETKANTADDSSAEDSTTEESTTEDSASDTTSTSGS
ncbi:preprotein translocase subunit SecG [Ostreibacterium oceani]|uniref:Protein-export membrane protein SecG n=1 Tax=Ostreibacterium oceani TaxID=2654998 RepID=A0A6N7ERM8_9GAMM|nr:preprotein translocase subunit SecG [Ostreibacterium oceani]MPV85142.1 preprotein translocase subunit SecG [Ostreibacterium oceani]